MIRCTMIYSNYHNTHNHLSWFAMKAINKATPMYPSAPWQYGQISLLTLWISGGLTQA